LKALPSLLQNISISMLSEDIYTRSGSTTLTSANSTCLFTATFYTYNSERLLATYGAGVAVTAICIVVGWRAVWLNGKDETMDFSRLLRALLNESLYEDRQDLSLDTKVKADADSEGQFRPVLK